MISGANPKRSLSCKCREVRTLPLNHWAAAGLGRAAVGPDRTGWLSRLGFDDLLVPGSAVEVGGSLFGGGTLFGGGSLFQRAEFNRQAAVVKA